MGGAHAASEFRPGPSGVQSQSYPETVFAGAARCLQWCDRNAIRDHDSHPERLRAELAQVVVHVEVRPPQPGGTRHPSENRMHTTVHQRSLRRD
jgi:hypothetical protein